MRIRSKAVILWSLAVVLTVMALALILATAPVEARSDNASCKGACGQDLGEALAVCAKYPKEKKKLMPAEGAAPAREVSLDLRSR